MSEGRRWSEGKKQVRRVRWFAAVEIKAQCDEFFKRRGLPTISSDEHAARQNRAAYRV